MQQVQDRLEFLIETPSDAELKRRFTLDSPARQQAKKQNSHTISGAPIAKANRTKRKAKRKAARKARARA